MMTALAMKFLAIRHWWKNQECMLSAVALTSLKGDGGRNQHARCGQNLISGANVRTSTGKTPVHFVFPKTVAYVPRMNLRPVVRKKRVAILTIDLFGHLQPVSPSFL